MSDEQRPARPHERRKRMRPATKAFFLLLVFASAPSLARADDSAQQAGQQQQGGSGELSAAAKLLLNTQWAPGQQWKWPPAERGKDKYTWVLSELGRQRGLTYMGTGARLRRVLDKLNRGENITVTTIGGSITAGQGAVDGHAWPQWLHNHMADEYGESVTFANGAVPGTLSSYMSVCLNIHVPKASDVVIVEYNQNDPSVSAPPFSTPHRKHYERLIRKLLNYPNRPAVILMHSYSWMLPFHPYHGVFYGGAERDYAEFAHYYDLPMLSVKACCHQLMVEGVDGFRIDVLRNSDQKGLTGIAFSWDQIHPDGNTGTRIMGELAYSLIHSTLLGLKQQPFTEAEEAVVQGPLPKPMIQNNWQSLHDSCFIGNHFTTIITEQNGFEWMNEAKPGGRPKWGYIATTVGSTLRMKVSTVASAAPVPKSAIKHHQSKKKQQEAKKIKKQQEGKAEESDPLSNMVLVEVAFLQSYEKMGRADVSCVSGCECQSTMLEGHTTHKASQLHLHMFHATQSPECVIEVKVREDSTVPGSHKIKVAGLIVSEEAGNNDGGVRNYAAVEYVHDVSFQAKDGTFDVKNHI